MDMDRDRDRDREGSIGLTHILILQHSRSSLLCLLLLSLNQDPWTGVIIVWRKDWVSFANMTTFTSGPDPPCPPPGAP